MQHEQKSQTPFDLYIECICNGVTCGSQERAGDPSISDFVIVVKDMAYRPESGAWTSTNDVPFTEIQVTPTMFACALRELQSALVRIGAPVPMLVSEALSLFE